MTRTRDGDELYRAAMRAGGEVGGDDAGGRRGGLATAVARPPAGGTLALCNFDTVKSFMGASTVSGIGDDAFWNAACDGPNLVPNHQLWAKAKGLTFELTSACHTPDSLAADKSDQTLIDLMNLAISRS